MTLLETLLLVDRLGFKLVLIPDPESWLPSYQGVGRGQKNPKVMKRSSSGYVYIQVQMQKVISTG